MPDRLSGSQSLFDQTKAILSKWLRDNTSKTISLSRKKLKEYRHKSFIVGWNIEVNEPSDSSYSFDVLLDAGFPYSAIRIAYKSENMYLKWPHVENEGLLCLPEAPPAIETGAIESIKQALTNAIKLIRSCQDKNFRTIEFEREFISYWNRSTESRNSKLLSLVNVKNHDCREISIWRDKGNILAGDSVAEVDNWLTNRNGKHKKGFSTGYFCHIPSPPTPPYFSSVREAYTALQDSNPELIELLSGHSFTKPIILILAAKSELGVGVFALEIVPPKSHTFGKKGKLDLAKKREVWLTHSKLKRYQVNRVDTDWVHGRGHTVGLESISKAKIAILGCGSVGSQVAQCLAQSGAGNLIVVDPEIIEPSNIGRHALGMDSLGKNKAASLAEMLRTKYPHANKIRGFECSWQGLAQTQYELLTELDLIISCMGEWASEGLIDEVNSSIGLNIPIIYGWLSEYGVSCHAVYTHQGGARLSCILNPDGTLKAPISTWKQESLTHYEPACGTVFQPYGPLDTLSCGSLVADLSLDVLTNRRIEPVHRIATASTEKLKLSGGQWTAEHLENRPKGFDGKLEYELPLSPCGSCHNCQR